ncbi:MAG: winged helix-turn-helix domain-containing protein [Pseudomonadota bacterium]
MSADAILTEFSDVEPFQIEDVTIIPRQLILKSPRGESNVEPKVMALLVTLAERELDVWTRAELIDRIWGIEFGGDESLTRAVHGLRKALGEPHGLRVVIKTLPKVGYRLDADVSPLVEPQASAAAATAEPEPAPPKAPAPATIAEKNHFTGSLSRRELFLAGGVAAVAASAIGLRLVSGGGDAGLFQTRNSLVILPFSNGIGDIAFDYLASGISEEIRHGLSRNQALSVVARRSSEAIKRRELSSSDIAEEFGVSLILDGRLTRSGDSVRLSTELIEAQSGITRWSEVYDAPSERLLAIQTAVSGQVSREVSEDLTDEAVLTLGLPTNPAAFDIYLRAKDQLAKTVTPDDALAALDVLEQAITLDPNFALAQTTKARWLSWVSGAGSDATAASAYLQEALSSAERALDLAPSLADTHSTLGWVRFFSALDVAGAADPFEQSIALAPNDAVILARYAPYIALVGQAEKARRTIQNAVLLDPLNPGIHRTAAMIHYYGGRPDQALSSIAELQNLQPNASVSQYWKGRAELGLQQAELAIETCESEPNLDAKLSCQGIGYARAGDPEQAYAALAELNQEYGDKAAYQQAQILAALGEDDAAMEALSLAWQKRDAGLVSLKVDTVFDRLRDREDFLYLLKSIGFGTD